MSSELKQLIEEQEHDKRESGAPRKRTEDEEPDEIAEDEELEIIEDEDGRGEIVLDDEEEEDL